MSQRETGDRVPVYHRAVKEGHFEPGTLELSPQWLKGSTTFLEEGAAFLIKDEPGVFGEPSGSPCACNG